MDQLYVLRCVLSSVLIVTLMRSINKRIQKRDAAENRIVFLHATDYVLLSPNEFFIFLRYDKLVYMDYVQKVTGLEKIK